MDPTTACARVLPAKCVEWQLLAPHGWLRTLVYVLNVRRENTSLHVSAASCKEHVIRVPVDREHSRTDRLLQLASDPPVALGVKRTDTYCSIDGTISIILRAREELIDVNAPCTARDRELVLVRTPAYECCSTVDAQQHKRRLPDRCTRLRVLRLLPHIGIPVLRASDDAVGIRRPVNGRNDFVMLQHGWPILNAKEWNAD